jgi:hypothetical protein
MAQHYLLRPGQPVTAAGAAEGNRNVVVDHLAATVGEDRRAAGKACPLLLMETIFAALFPAEAFTIKASNKDVVNTFQRYLALNSKETITNGSSS